MIVKHRLRNFVENFILRLWESFFTKKHEALTLHIRSKLFFIREGANVSEGLNYLKFFKKTPSITNYINNGVYLHFQLRQGIIYFYRIIKGKKEMNLWIALRINRESVVNCSNCGKEIMDEWEYHDNKGICDDCYSIPLKKAEV